MMFETVAEYSLFLYWIVDNEFTKDSLTILLEDVANDCSQVLSSIHFRIVSDDFKESLKTRF